MVSLDAIVGNEESGGHPWWMHWQIKIKSIRRNFNRRYVKKILDECINELSDKHRDICVVVLVGWDANVKP